VKPAFRITHDDEDITARIADRLLSLRVTDEAGITADQFEVVLDNRDSAIAVPETGAVLTVDLGWTGQPLARMGQYTVDEIEASGLPRTLRLAGKSADMKASLKSWKKRHWFRTTIGKIVETVAAEHGLKPRCADKYALIAIDHTEQLYESDMNLLTRLADQYGAVMKPAGGYLLFMERGAGVTSTGEPLPTVAIAPTDVIGNGGWRTSIAERQYYACVGAHLRQKRLGEHQYFYAGKGEPVMYLRHPYRSESDALAAARAKLLQLQRGRTSLSLNLIGNAALCAEMPVQLTGFDALTDGEWIVTQAEHRLDAGGFATSLQAQRREDFVRDESQDRRTDYDDWDDDDD